MSNSVYPFIDLCASYFYFRRDIKRPSYLFSLLRFARGHAVPAQVRLVQWVCDLNLVEIHKGALAEFDRVVFWYEVSQSQTANVVVAGNQLGIATGKPKLVLARIVPALAKRGTHVDDALR